MVDACALMDIRTSQAADLQKRNHTLQFTFFWRTKEIKDIKSQQNREAWSQTATLRTNSDLPKQVSQVGSGSGPSEPLASELHLDNHQVAPVPLEKLRILCLFALCRTAPSTCEASLWPVGHPNSTSHDPGPERPEVSLVGGTRLGENHGLPEEVFRRGRRVELPAMLPLHQAPCNLLQVGACPN